jgi:hypothetical protein
MHNDQHHIKTLIAYCMLSAITSARHPQLMRAPLSELVMYGWT